MTRLVLSLLAMFISSIPSHSQEDSRWVRKSIRSSCDWWENCTYRYRYRTVRYHRLPAVRVYGDSDRHSDRACQDFVQTVGPEKYGRERAKEAAEQFWMEEVRSKHGVRWMDLRNSRGGTWECGRSSTGNRQSENAADAVGKYLEQCVLRARPCRAELERVNKD